MTAKKSRDVLRDVARTEGYVVDGHGVFDVFLRPDRTVTVMFTRRGGVLSAAVELEGEGGGPLPSVNVRDGDRKASRVIDLLGLSEDDLLDEAWARGGKDPRGRASRRRTG